MDDRSKEIMQMKVARDIIREPQVAGESALERVCRVVLAVGDLMLSDMIKEAEEEQKRDAKRQ